MKRINLILTVIISIFLITSSFAQDKPAETPKYGWQKEIVGGINLTQTGFDNWAQGGENSFAWQLNLNTKFVNDQEKTNWANTGKFSYGNIKTGDLEARKSVDEIKLESVFTYKANIYVNPYVAATGETQFAPGYNYGINTKVEISKVMDPGYFRESAGLGYSPNQIVKTRLGVALKQTITDKYSLLYTKKEDNMKNEIGAESVTDLSWKVAENSLFTSKLELFSNVKSVDEIDVNWDNVLTTKITKYFNVNFNFRLLYDKDVSEKRQIKQAIALGLSYTFL